MLTTSTSDFHPNSELNTKNNGENLAVRLGKIFAVARVGENSKLYRAVNRALNLFELNDIYKFPTKKEFCSGSSRRNSLQKRPIWRQQVKRVMVIAYKILSKSGCRNL